MIRVPGLGELTLAVEGMRETLEDLSQVHREVGYPYVLELARQNLESEGAHSGAPWSFVATGETDYLARKVAAGADPRALFWKPGERAELVPSIVDPAHPRHVATFSRERSFIGSRARNADATRAGVGPAGESYPDRDPYRASPAQRQELRALYLEAIASLMRSRRAPVRVR